MEKTSLPMAAEVLPTPFDFREIWSSNNNPIPSLRSLKVTETALQ